MDLGISISANINQKKIFKDINNSLKKFPLDNITFSLNGQKNNNSRLIIGTILIVLGLSSIIFGFYNYQKQPVIPQCILPKSNYIEPQANISTPIPINKKINILILNATNKKNIALNLKNTLVQNMFESVSIGNNNLKTNFVTIEYKSELKTEAEYLRDNYSSLLFANLSSSLPDNSLNDISITLGKQYISK